MVFPWRTWLTASVLGPSEASYTAYLQQHGYCSLVLVAYLHAVGHFAHWLTHERVRLRDLDESVVRRFVRSHLPECDCPGRCQRTAVLVQAALRRLLETLRADGRIPARHDGLSPAIHDELERFTTYLDTVCGLAAKTRADRRWWMAQFLTDQFNQGPIAVSRLNPRDIAEHLKAHGADYTPSTARERACALRSYLRFRATHYADRAR
jgi:integrase/recombinase XerD